MTHRRPVSMALLPLQTMYVTFIVTKISQVRTTTTFWPPFTRRRVRTPATGASSAPAPFVNPSQGRQRPPVPLRRGQTKREFSLVSPKRARAPPPLTSCLYSRIAGSSPAASTPSRDSRRYRQRVAWAGGRLPTERPLSGRGKSSRSTLKSRSASRQASPLGSPRCPLPASLPRGYPHRPCRLLPEWPLGLCLLSFSCIHLKRCALCNYTWIPKYFLASRFTNHPSLSLVTILIPLPWTQRFSPNNSSISSFYDLTPAFCIRYMR